MRWIWMSVAVVGGAAAALGMLWFLQGSDLVHLDPVACAADCEPVVGHQPRWQLAGGVTFLGGVLATVHAMAKLRGAHRSTSRAPRFSTVLGRTYAAMLGVAAPLLALLLTPGLMRSRAAWFEGSSWIGVIGFELLSLLAVLGSVVVSAAVAGTPQWRPTTAWRSSRTLRQRYPRRWWRAAGEAFGGFLASQIVGGFLAWLMPTFWRDGSGDGWVLSYSNYAMQAIGIYLVICLAAAWFGTRVRGAVIALATPAPVHPQP